MPIDFSDLIPADGASQSAPSQISFDDLIPRRVSTAGDVARAVPSGLAQGAAAVAGLPALGKTGVDWLVRNAPALWGGHVISPEEAAAQDAQRGPDLIPDVGDVSRYAQQAIEAIPGVGYKPQTTAGRYAQTAAEFVPGALMAPGGMVGNAIKFGVVPGVASEAAGEATQGTALEPYARALAPIVAGGGAALAGRPGTAAQAVREAAGPLDQPTLQAAQDLMDAAQARGAPLTLAEAVQQVTNGGTRLGSLQRVVEQSRGGADPMARFYADRPGQVQQAGNTAIDQIGPIPPNPSVVGPLVQNAAQGALDASPQGLQAATALQGAGPRVTPEQVGQVVQPALRSVYDARLNARSTQAASDYAAAAGDTVPADGVQGVIDDLGQQMKADKTGLLAPRLADLRRRLSTEQEVPGWAPDNGTPLPAGAAPPPAPLEDYNPPPTAVRPAGIPRPQPLQDFVKAAGGVQDPRGDLKSMGLDRVPGLIAKPGSGLGPDAIRQVAAEAGYLGPDIDHAMAGTDINDLFDALGRHPVYSVRDAGAVDAWHAYDTARSDADALGRPTSTPARPPAAPGLPDVDPPATQVQRVPITDVENLNRTRKTFRDRIDLPATAPKAIDKETAAKIGPVLQQLDSVMQDGSSAYAAANRNFAANSVPLELFEHTPALASAVERDPYGTRFMTPADQVPGLIDRGGPAAARAFTSVAPNPARAAYENHLTTQLLDSAMGSNGRINVDRLATAMRDQSDTLQQFPAVQARVQRVVDTQRALEPLQSTMVGHLAASRDFREQASIILDPNPVPGSAGEVGDAVQQLAAREPGAARALVSQKVRQTFNEATQSNMGGPNQWGGAKFAAVVQGNTQQARNLKAAVEALHGPGVWRDFQKTLDVFEAMGRRQAPGSQTEFNRQIAADLGKGGKVGGMVTTIASPTKALGKAQEIYQGWKYGRNTDALAALLTRPDAAKVLASIAGKSPSTTAAQGQAALYLLGAAANQGRKGAP